jgi:hypothetical protein
MAENGMEVGSFEPGEDLTEEGRTLLQQQELAGGLEGARQNTVLWSVVIL